jgi:ferrous iron transport protein B
MRGPVVFALAAIAVAAVALHLIFPMQVITGAGLFPSLEIVFVMILATALAGPEKTERFVLDPATGIITLLSVIFVIYQLVGVFAAGTLVGLLEKDVFSAFVVPAVARLSGTGFFRDLLVGDYGLVSMGLAYAVSIVLPIMTVFFLVFGILEDTGYFPRLTAFTNRVFRLIGVNGKATLPIVLGFGCVTMAVLSSRILETRKERLIVVFLLALAVPCSAQLGIMMALMSAISIKAIVLIALIVIGQFFIFGRILVRLIGGSVSDFMMELPPMRVPRLANIARKTGARAMWFLREALPYFMVATLILFALDRTGGMQFIYKAAGPIASKILGLPVETAPVFILGFFRRDYGAAGLYRLWQSGMLTGNQIVISLVVMSLFLPCLATLIVIVKELGMRWALTIMLFVMSVSLLTGGILNLVLNLSGVTF